MRRIARGADILAGLGGAAVGLGVGELSASFFGTSPVGAVASWVIDLSPAWLKEAAIAVAGTSDKLLLVVALVIAVAVAAAAAGVLERIRPPWGSAVFVALGLATLAAVLTRTGASGISPLPALLGAAVAIGMLRLLTRLARREERAEGRPPDASRRLFLASSVGTIVVGAVTALVAQSIAIGGRATEAARKAIRLPQASVAATPVSPASSVDVAGVSPLITPNAQFYRIDTAIFVPVIDPTGWRLRITGMVEHEVEIGYQELLALPLVESHITLTCVSNPVGGDLISTATWLGYPVRALLSAARPMAGADMVLSKSSDGFTAGTPLSALTDGRDALLAVGMNGVPLPQEHGFPVRLVVPGLYGYVSATKWLVELEVTRFDRVQAYWTQRGWGEKGPVKLASRIDVPKNGAQVAAGRAKIAGVAWEQHTGVSRVEVRIDDGPWQEARLADELTIDTWRLWSWDWEAQPGSHRLAVRATDANGTAQDAMERGVLPDGATGLHSITVTV